MDETLRRLHLCNDERIVRQRRQWLKLYEQGKLDFAGLQELAPLIAEAVQARDQNP